MNSNTQTTRQFLETLSSEGVEAALARYAGPGLVWWSSGAGEVQDRIVDFMRAFGSQVCGHPELTLLGTTTEGDRVAAEVSMRAELTENRFYDNTFHFLFVFDNGSITRINEYHDTRHAYDTIGSTLREVGFIND